MPFHSPASLWEAVLDQVEFAYGSARLHFCDADWRISDRVIPDEMLHLLLQGSIEWQVGTERFVSRPGDFVLIPPAVPWSARRVSEELLHLVVIHFEARFPASQRFLPALNFPLLFEPDAGDGFEALLAEMCRVDRDTSPGVVLRQRALLMELAWRLFPYRGRPGPRVGAGLLEDAGADRVWEIISYLRENLARDLTRPELARRFHLAESTLAALFRKHTGQSPMQYLTKLRLEEAQRRRLRTTDLSVAQVAQRSGYDDPEYFGRLFRKHTGLTPREFRRQGIQAPPHAA